jgi:hypothetical protein
VVAKAVGEVRNGVSIEELLRQAESGDLRPQVNPLAVVSRLRSVPDDEPRSPVVRALLRRFFQLARPIGDASRDSGPHLRLSDAGPFFYLVESLQRLNCAEVLDTMLVLLDDFSQLEPRSYDELYLWCIVQLSRSDSRHVAQFWPMVLTLDLRYRSEAWQRSPGVSLVEQPYRLTELLFYYYVLYTLARGRNGKRTVPSLARRVQRLGDRVSETQRELMAETLNNLAKAERRPDFGDALGLLQKRPT